MERIMDLLMEIVAYEKFRNDALEVADFIVNLEENELTILKELFEILDIEIEDEYDYIYYIADNLDSLLEEIEEYITLRNEERYETGEFLFEMSQSIDENKFYASEDDLLGDDWEDIFRIEEDLYTEPGGCIMYGTRPSEKKDRSKVVWKPGDLEGDFVDSIEG